MHHFDIDTFYKLSDGTFKLVALVGTIFSMVFKKIQGYWPWD